MCGARVETQRAMDQVFERFIGRDVTRDRPGLPLEWFAGAGTARALSLGLLVEAHDRVGRREVGLRILNGCGAVRLDRLAEWLGLDLGIGDVVYVLAIFHGGATPQDACRTRRYLEARYSKKSASASVERSRSLRSTLSSSECAFENGSPAPVRRSVAFGKAMAKSATNGMVPPAPMKTGSRSNASFIARRIASYAAPLPSSLYGLPEPRGVMDTSAPHGTC